jgi:hypothetical protein
MTVTNPTIATLGLNFSSSGSATLTFYGVQSEEIRKTSGLIDLPMPTKDSDGKIVMDLMGAGREISISGIVTEGDVGTGNLYKYAQDIAGLQSAGTETLVNGVQGTSHYTYTPECMNRTGGAVTITVVVIDARITAERANLGSLAYSVTMMETRDLI